MAQNEMSLCDLELPAKSTNLEVSSANTTAIVGLL